jgi:hypothetical protein
MRGGYGDRTFRLREATAASSVTLRKATMFLVRLNSDTGPHQLRVLLLQLLQPPRLVHLQTVVLDLLEGNDDRHQESQRELALRPPKSFGERRNVKDA